MNIRFTNDIDDVVAFSRFYAENSPGYKKRVRQQVLSWGLLIFVVFSLPAIYIHDWFPLVLGAVGAVVFVLYYEWWLRRRFETYTRETYRGWENIGLLGEHEIELGEDSLTIRTQVSEEKLKWAGVAKIVSNEDYTFIYVGPNNAHILPRSKVVDGDYESFVKGLEEAFQRVRA